MQYTSKRAKKLIPNSIFSKMNKLAQNNNVINFGIGFPDYPASDFIKEAAIQAIKNDMNQYASWVCP
jgi:aminotransferase